MASSSFILLFLSLVYMGCEAGSPVAASSHASNFIKSSCSTTKYPALCIQSLAAFAPSIQQSPRQLAQTALSVSLDRARATQAFVSKMRKFKGLKKREYEAIKDCIEEMSEGVDRLSKSVQELKHMGQAKGQDFLWHISNVETWVSAALTDENTCFDGFAGKGLDGKVKASIRRRVINVAQVTSNALSLVNQFASKQ
ncbi:21 kDa protein [Hibiscus syriacus]|uniref:21 kDa protein n=1 Tax=Hibiscus syriacus TaxID=106335 RepID=A0A6A3APH7_HIBSY|nr:21 kDa protein-like [Hibiscus syriacus]KAE8705247.1 21 kDa protein [Hibiscus syriacus]